MPIPVDSNRKDSISWFDTLPDELIIWIIRILAIDDFRSLCKFKVVNRRLHRLSIENVYHKFFHYTDPILFFRTIATSPDLAKHVRVVDWGYKSNEGYVVPSQALSNADKGIIASSLTTSETPDNYVYAALFPELLGREKEKEAFLYAFLMCTPRLKHLSIANSRRFDLYSYWFKPLGDNPDRFAYLESASLRGPLNIEHIVPLLMLPSLRKLEITEAITPVTTWGLTNEWMLEGHQIKDMLRRGSFLEHLHIRDSSIDFPSLSELFESFKSLKTFEYRYVFNPRGMATKFRKGMLYSAAEALASQSHSIENIQLHDYYAIESPAMKFGLLALHRFEKLRSLTLGPLFSPAPSSELIDVESFLSFFPPQVEYLSLQPFEDCCK